VSDGYETMPWQEDFTYRLPARFKTATFETFIADPDTPLGHVKAEVASWAALAGGATPDKGLFLTGAPGLGKSHLAIAAGRYLSAYAPVRYVDASRYVESRRRAVGEGRSSSAGSVWHGYSAGILDEFGAMRPTDFLVEQMELLIDEAWRRIVPLVVTSNLTYREIKDTLGERTSSRLVDLTHKVEFAGDDYRLGR
jgi:DNA replication protein DnaC